MDKAIKYTVDMNALQAIVLRDIYEGRVRTLNVFSRFWPPRLPDWRIGVYYEAVKRLKTRGLLETVGLLRAVRCSEKGRLVYAIMYNRNFEPIETVLISSIVDYLET